MDITLIRHATLLVSVEGINLLIDPVLSPARSRDAVSNSPNQRRNPLVDLPLDDAGLSKMLDGLDGVLVTHTHLDHWDEKAQAILDREMPIFCQPEDEKRISEAGFNSVLPIDQDQVWRGLHIFRTAGQHGTGQIGELMAPVSGYVIQAQGEPGLYITGDTIWCQEVEDSLNSYQPDVIVVNSGAAQFLTGGPITMTAEDVLNVCIASPDAEVIAVHMEAINHCLLSRAELKRVVTEAGVDAKVKIPADGETMSF